MLSKLLQCCGHPLPFEKQVNSRNPTLDALWTHCAGLCLLNRVCILLAHVQVSRVFLVLVLLVLVLLSCSPVCSDILFILELLLWWCLSARVTAILSPLLRPDEQRRSPLLQQRSQDMWHCHDHSDDCLHPAYFRKQECPCDFAHAFPPAASSPASYHSQRRWAFPSPRPPSFLLLTVALLLCSHSVRPIDHIHWHDFRVTRWSKDWTSIEQELLVAFSSNHPNSSQCQTSTSCGTFYQVLHFVAPYELPRRFFWYCCWNWDFWHVEDLPTNGKYAADHIAFHANGALSSCFVSSDRN